MHPEVQQKLYEEIKEVFHSEDVKFELNTLYQLTYLDQVVKETLRLYPVAPMISRECTKDIVLDGLVIPESTILFFNFYALHRRTDLWGPDAHKFDPENFSAVNVLERHPCAFLPFSGISEFSFIRSRNS